MRKGLGALLALFLALLPGIARGEAVFTREVGHVVSMEAIGGGLLLSGSYAEGGADRPSFKFFDFAWRRLYSCGDHAHDGICRDVAFAGDGGVATLWVGTHAEAPYRVDFFRGRERIWSWEMDGRGASNLFCDGRRILVDGAPALRVSTLTALGMDGTALWEARWEESLRFDGILACAEGYLAYGYRVEAEEYYPIAVCVDEQGVEAWRYEGQEWGTAVAACVDGEDVLLLAGLADADAGTRLLRLRAGEVVRQAGYPRTEIGEAVTDGVLALCPYRGGYLILEDLFENPSAVAYLLRQVDAEGGTLAEWRVDFPELYNGRMAALVPCGDTAYLAVYGRPAAEGGWDAGLTIADAPSMLVVRKVGLPEG